MRGRVLAPLLALAVALALPAVAAAWNQAGSGQGYGKARSLAAGNQPTASATGGSVTVSWTAPSGGAPVTGYVVKRYSTGGAEQTVGSSCDGIVAGTSCTENSVAPGTWRYTVTPARQSWRGAEGPQSAAVNVAAPALTLAPATVTALPQTLTGQITGFEPGQTVTFRLDDPVSGQALTGSITPSPVPASGTASVSVILPAGVANGAHTVFAVGSAGDTASTAVTVSLATTIETAAFDWRDQSSGAETNQSELVSFDDNRTTTSGAFAASFAGTRYLEYRLNSPLRPGYAMSGATFDFRYAGNAPSVQSCFYLEVRRASDDAVLGIHGSSASPVGCVTGLTETSFSVPLTEVDTSAKANDLNIRVYGRGNPVATSFVVDEATVSGTGADGAFTLYPVTRLNAAGGLPGTTAVWPLFADDAALYTSGNAWQSTYTATRYLRAAFPAYVPSGAAVNSATLTHSYRSGTNGRQVCNYVEIYSGSTLIGTHGSPTANVSCNSSNTTDQTDAIALPEVDTVVEANALSARIYLRRPGASTTSAHDIVRLSVTYTK